MSRRSKKRVDYAVFGEDDNDDDFAEFTPPASKRQKTSNNVKKTSDKDNKEKKKPSKSRPSIEDKVYERELQAALELSMSESQSSSSEQLNEKPEDKENVINQNGREVKVIETKAVISPCKDDDEEIVVLEAEVEDKPLGRTPRRSAAKKSVVKADIDSDADSDFDINKEDDDDEEETDIDFDDENDSDFDDKKTKPKAKTKTEAKSKSKPAASKLVPKTNAKSTSKASSSTCSTPKVAASGLKKSKASKPAASVSGTPRGINSSLSSPVPRWNPPGLSVNKTPVNSGIPMKSPTSGIRVGLSRNMKLKPLHPNLKVKP